VPQDAARFLGRHPALVAGIRAFAKIAQSKIAQFKISQFKIAQFKAWMAGTGPAMTNP
jgi:hypothetical protein